jgi:hypothetical protein
MHLFYMEKGEAESLYKFGLLRNEELINKDNEGK